ncbi:MAG: glutaminyl-peptide cyclotransferase [Pseudomonadota bacterium]
MKQLLGAVIVVLLVAVPAAADLPILHDGEAPQVGHERIYGQTAIPVYRYDILKTYDHDTADYTEALFMNDGHLFEGTGQYGKSRLKTWDLETGEVIRQRELDDRYFGEGAVALNGVLYQLTYISNIAFTYRADDLTPTESFRYLHQGWGLTTDGEHLIMSDGSAAILFIEPDDMGVHRHIIVHDAYSEVGFLNELEYVDGDIYANIWQTDYIVRFSAETGEVNGWVDLTGLNPDPKTLVYPHVLNGIAYTGEPGTLLVTGKNWPNLWHIRLTPVANTDP